MDIVTRALRGRARRAGLVTASVVVAGVAMTLSALVRGSGGPSAADAVHRTSAGQVASWERAVVSDAGLEDRNGVRITSVSMSGAGGLVDLRFLVVDPNSAGALHDAANPPALVDEETGLVVSDLLMGHSHTGDFRAGATYYLVFENPGNLIRAGSRVSVLLGNTEVEHVVVR